VGVPPGDPPNPDLFGRLFLLIPCDENHGDSECEDGGESTAATIRNSPPPVKQTSTEASHGSLTPETLAALRACVPV
jgi:hypothetical protein